MSNEQFEIAFSGQIREGADLQEVKARIGKMFKADGAKLDRLFSGQRIVIKANVDQQTAQKYQSALLSAGAECEIRSMSTTPAEAVVAAPPAPAVEAQPVARQEPTPDQVPSEPDPQTTSANEPPRDFELPPQTAPLSVTADQIGELAATLAPPGSELQDERKVAPIPQYDLSAFEMAPVGSVLGDEKKAPPPPPPDTTGLSMLDE